MNLWFDHYNYLNPILERADQGYPGNHTDGGWSFWYPLTTCMTLRYTDDSAEEVGKYRKMENWHKSKNRRDFPKKRGDSPLVSDLAYTNKYFKSGLAVWMAQLRVRYCTEQM